MECNDRVGYSPRAKTTKVRTREHLRRWGIADALRAASPTPPDYPPDMVFATRMSGPALARFENAFNGRRVRSEWYLEEAQWVPQYTLEEVLRARAAALPGVEARFETQAARFEQDEAGVNVGLEDARTSARTTVRCAYLVGADGARSTMRDAIGATMMGDDRAVFGNYSVIFRAPRPRPARSARSGDYVLAGEPGRVGHARTDGYGRTMVLHGHEAARRC